MNDMAVLDPATGETLASFALTARQIDGEWSPDRSEIVYQGGEGSSSQIFTTTGDGTQRQLTRFPRGAAGPTWSPSGERIAFVAPNSPTGSPDLNVMRDDTDVFVMRTNGDEKHRLLGREGPVSRPFDPGHPPGLPWVGDVRWTGDGHYHERLVWSVSE